MSTNTLSQFIRIESFARVPSKNKKKRSGHRPAAGIVGEVQREPAFCKHVERPLQPKILYGSPTDTLNKALSMADKARDSRGHKLRKDAHILAGSVCSYPVSVAEVVRKPIEQPRLTEWIKRACRWTFDYFGRQNVGAIVLHMDESHPHLHILVTPPEPGMEPSPLRRAGKEALRRAGKKDPKRHALERQAYSDKAMQLQKSFHEYVSQFFEHKRSTKGRRRVTRAEWVRARAKAHANPLPALSAHRRGNGSLSPRDTRPTLRSATAPSEAFKPAADQRDSNLATKRSLAAIGGFHPALRAPSNSVSAYRKTASSPVHSSPASRPSTAPSRDMTNVAPASSPRSAPSGRAKSWKGNDAAGNEAHKRALSALKMRATPTGPITEELPEVEANLPADDSPDFGM